MSKDGSSDETALPTPAGAPARRRVAPWLSAEGDQPWVLGHRGLPRRFPENTIEGFLAALNAGADGVEMDVRVTRDGVPVVAHDKHLKRTHGERLHVADTDLSLLPVPHLDEILRAVWRRHPQAKVDLELKVPVAHEALDAAVADAKGGERVAVTSFDTAVVRDFRKHSPLPIGLVTDERYMDERRAREMLHRYDPDILVVRFPVFLRRIVEAVHAEGRSIWVWTPNRRSQLRKAARLGVDAVITDRPALAVEMLQGEPSE